MTSMLPAWGLICLTALSVTVHAESETHPTCFADAIPESARKDLKGALSGRYPIGVWVNGWPAGYATAAVVHILLEEKVGYNTVETGPGPNTVDGFYALTGCATPLNIQDRGCSETMTTYNHISVEGWSESYTSTWEAIERDYPQNAPRNLGNMGYMGKTSYYLPEDIQQAAYNEEGWILEWYKGFNVSWTSPARYFDPLSAINKSLLKPCEDTRLMISEVMERYANLTDDWDGVVEVEVVDSSNATVRVVQGRCWDGFFWYPPSCRDQPSSCVPFFTGGNGYNMEETMQKATAWNMPLAPAVGKTWGDFTQLPLHHRSTFFWWVPDPTFLLLKPLEISFPPFDRAAHSRGDQRTSPTSLSVDKYVSQDLQILAPPAEQLIRAFLIDLNAVNAMLLDQLQTGDSWWDVACRWLKGNEKFWTSWLPDPTNCFAGFGLYHSPSQSFVEDRSDPDGLSCQACPSGTFSSRLADKAGLTFVCLPCPAGTAQLSGASLECTPCAAGEYQDAEGSRSCKRCGRGEYQDQPGSIGCIPCPLGTSTYSTGSALLRECGCVEGTIDVALRHNGSDSDAAARCEACAEGLYCPLGADLASLTSGKSNFPNDLIPRVLEGYFSRPNQPVDIYKCQAAAFCPGGLPGSCAGGREVVPCADCPPGTSWIDTECATCTGERASLWALACCVVFIGLTMLYYLIAPKIASKATPREGLSMIFSIAFNIAQSIAILGLTTVKWPKAFQSVSGNFQLFLLDLEDWSIACFARMSPSLRYIGSTLMFPLVILWLLFCFCASAWVCRLCRKFRRAKWSFTRTLNTIGFFLQGCFGTMSALALKPMMCYQHPNGKYSLLKHAGVFCDSPEQKTMLAAGLVLLICFVCSFLGICTWAVFNIPKWSVNHVHRVASCSFLVNRFTMYRWWYGVPDLARGTLLSLCPVFATDFPPLQALMLTTVLVGFLLLHMRFLPWKIPAVNFLEGWLLSMMLLQVAVTPAFDSTGVEDFNQGISLFVLCSMASTLALVTFVLCMAFVYGVCRGHGEDMDFILLDLGRRPDSTLLLEKMQEVAKDLLNIHAEQVESGFRSLHPGDLTRISDSIDMIATDLLGICSANSLNLNRVVTFSQAHQRLRSTMNGELPPELLAKLQMPSDASPQEVDEDSEGAEEEENFLIECGEGCEEVMAESANLEGASSEAEAQGNETRASL